MNNGTSSAMRRAAAEAGKVKRRHEMPFGATLLEGGATFRLWAPAARSVELMLDGGSGEQAQAMTRREDGWHEAFVAAARAGNRYRYRTEAGLCVPDPASRFNPMDVHGPSELVDALAFEWQDEHWRGRPWHEAVVYELHVGTFSPEGSFAGVESRLDYLASLGVTAIELMPLADFPGARGWGYDGVLQFAPDATYGRPDDLKRLVQAAHQRGLMMLLDVVYNHFGPDGNYLHAYAPQFFTDRHETPWGKAINYDGPGSDVVRRFFIHNALYWLEEFHFDGLRFDAVHAIRDDSKPDFLEELATAVRNGPGREREIHLVLENDLNDSDRLERSNSKPLQYNAQWNDDYHHAAHALLTGETDGYYADYPADSAHAMARCIAEGFAYQGEPSPFRRHDRRGKPSAHLPCGAFVDFIQNHDQVGNRAMGERLVQLADENALRAMTAVLLLAPSPPLLFMGEEFGAATPFLFFCDFKGELAEATREGRRREFSQFARFRDPEAARAIPDPLDEKTFEQSRLDWASLQRDPHKRWLDFYRELLSIRRERIAPLIPGIRGSAERMETGKRFVHLKWQSGSHALVLRATFGEAHEWKDARGELLYATPPGAWTAAWSVEGA
jgi:malto-oligosyltrehalose trehalohydrolase